MTVPTWPYDTVMGATYHGWQRKYGDTYALVKYDNRPVDKLRKVRMEYVRPERKRPWYSRLLTWLGSLSSGR